MATSNINRVVLTGNLTRDPELRTTQSGTPVCSLRIASNTRRKTSDGEWVDKPNYFSVTVWGAQGENCHRFLAKGRPVASTGASSGANGRPGRSKREAVEIVADTVQFLGSAPNANSKQDGDDAPSEPEPIALAAARTRTTSRSDRHEGRVEPSGSTRPAPSVQANRPWRSATGSSAGATTASPTSTTAPAATVLETRQQGLLIETDAGPLRTLPAAYVGRARRARLLPDRARHAGRHRRARHRGRHAARVDARLELHRAVARPSGDAAAHRRPGRARRGTGRARRARAPRRPPAPAARRRARAGGAAHDHPRRRGPRRDPAAHPAGARPARRRRTARGATAGPERTAAEAEPAAAAPDQRAALREVRAELGELAAQRAALPLRELRELDAVEQERAQVRGQRDDVAARLAALPAPQRGVLGRTKDPHAAERARLAAAVDVPLVPSVEPRAQEGILRAPAYATANAGPSRPATTAGRGIG